MTDTPTHQPIVDYKSASLAAFRALKLAVDELIQQANHGSSDAIEVIGTLEEIILTLRDFAPDDMRQTIEKFLHEAGVEND
jgi:uncharacterized membrane protein